MEEIQIERPNDFTDPDVLYDELIATVKRVHPNEDLSLLERAYMTAKNAHMDQRRKSGEPYIIHPVCVAIILADLELDIDTIIAGLLHDAIEDTILNKEQLTRIFGKEAADIVDGVTKLTMIDMNMDKTQEQAENLRKMFLAMSNDIRVIVVKLADRLHNMRTLKYMKPEKQKEKSRETLDIYSPIAQRLGIIKIKDELDDLALLYLYPDVYKNLQEKLDDANGEQAAKIDTLVREVSNYMNESGIKSDIKGRVKHKFSIYRKMVRQNKTLSQIYDIFAIRIIVDSIKDCYAALGIIHEHYKPIPGRFKDYIAMPKPNMYQSLHTTVIGEDGTPFEIQIRTLEMHRIAEFGIAAHWKYKEVGDSKTNASGKEDEKMNWLHQILEVQTDTSDNQEFLSAIKTDLDLFSDSVYCFTPNGQVKTLPAGSTPIDFAYSVHSAVGNKMVGARANGNLVNIDYKIQNGDRIEIITSQNSRGPSRDWLNIVKSASAKNKINQWFRATFKEDNIVKGREAVEKYCKSHQIDFADINRPEIVEKICSRYTCKDWDSVLAIIGHGGIKEGQVLNRMVEERNRELKKEETDEQVLEVLSEASKSKAAKVKIRGTDGGIVVKGVHDLAVRFSRCCNPVPGDEIVGYVTRGRGVTIHRTDCVNVIEMDDDDRARLISAEWQQSSQSNNKYLTMLTVYCNNRTGLVVDVSRIFTEKNIDIIGVQAHIGKNDSYTIEIQFEVNDASEIKNLIEKIRQIPNVLDVMRA